MKIVFSLLTVLTVFKVVAAEPVEDICTDGPSRPILTPVPEEDENDLLLIRGSSKAPTLSPKLDDTPTSGPSFAPTNELLPPECPDVFNSIMLVNSDTDLPERPLYQDMTVDLSEIGPNLNMVFDVTAEINRVEVYDISTEELLRADGSRPFTLGGDNGNPAEPTYNPDRKILPHKGTYALEARARIAGTNEWLVCPFSFSVVYSRQEVCPGLVQGFSIYDAVNDTWMFDLDSTKTNRIVLSDLQETYGVNRITLVAETVRHINRVQWHMDGQPFRNNSHWPFSIRAERNREGVYDYYPFMKFSVPGTYVVAAQGRTPYNGHSYEPMTDACTVTVEIVTSEREVCAGMVERFVAYDADTGDMIKVLDTAEDNVFDLNVESFKRISVLAETNGLSRRVKFSTTRWEPRRHRWDIEAGNRWQPYSLAGIRRRDGVRYVRGYRPLELPGKHTVSAYAEYFDKTFEPIDMECSVTIQIEMNGPYTCNGPVTNVSVVDAVTDLVVIDDLQPGQEINLADYSDFLTLRANDNSLAGAVKFFLDGTRRRTEGRRPYSLGGDDNAGDYNPSRFMQAIGDHVLRIEPRFFHGQFWASEDYFCTIPFKITNDHGGRCMGGISGLSLINAESDGVIATLNETHTIDLSEVFFPITVRANNASMVRNIQWRLDDNFNHRIIWQPPYSLSWRGLRVDGTFDYRPVHSLLAPGTHVVAARPNFWGGDPGEWCESTINVIYGSGGLCPNSLVRGFALYDANTDKVVDGYHDLMATGNVIDFNKIGTRALTIVAKALNVAKRVRFMVNGNRGRQSRNPPYAMAGVSNDPNTGVSDYKAHRLFRNNGKHTISAFGQRQDNTWETEAACEIEIEIVNIPPPRPRRREDFEPVTPTDYLSLAEDACRPQYISGSIQGRHMFFKTPTRIIDTTSDTNVTFQVQNFVKESETIDAVTTVFTSAETGEQYCDMVTNAGFAEIVGNYTAECNEQGFAMFDLYAFDAGFGFDGADTSALPDECKISTTGGVAGYQFAVPCNCDNLDDPVVLDFGAEIPAGGIPAMSSGDPHLRTYERVRYDCQGVGHFVLTKGDIFDYPVDPTYGQLQEIVLEGRFAKLANRGNRIISIGQGIAAKEYYTVQLVAATDQRSNEYDKLGTCNVQYTFNGEPKSIFDQVNDDYLVTKIEGSSVLFYFRKTGWKVKVSFRGGRCSSTITSYLPTNNPRIVNLRGLFGTPNNNQADEWMTADGDLVTFTRNRQVEYEYCVREWCVRDENLSVFKYHGNETFTEFNLCDFYDWNGGTDTFEEDLDPALVQEAREHCGDNDQCLFDFFTTRDLNDAVTGGLDAADEDEAVEEQNFEELPASTACCSNDWKACYVNADAAAAANCNNQFTCDACIPGTGLKTFLSNGPLEGCAALNEGCGDGCCSGLTCVSGTCEFNANPAVTVRRLRSLNTEPITPMPKFLKAVVVEEEEDEEFFAFESSFVY